MNELFVFYNFRRSASAMYIMSDVWKIKSHFIGSVCFSWLNKFVGFYFFTQIPTISSTLTTAHERWTPLETERTEQHSLTLQGDSSKLVKSLSKSLVKVKRMVAREGSFPLWLSFWIEFKAINIYYGKKNPNGILFHSGQHNNNTSIEQMNSFAR